MNLRSIPAPQLNKKYQVIFVGKSSSITPMGMGFVYTDKIAEDKKSIMFIGSIDQIISHCTREDIMSNGLFSAMKKRIPGEAAEYEDPIPFATYNKYIIKKESKGKRTVYNLYRKLIPALRSSDNLEFIRSYRYIPKEKLKIWDIVRKEKW